MLPRVVMELEGEGIYEVTDTGQVTQQCCSLCPGPGCLQRSFCFSWEMCDPFLQGPEGRHSLPSVCMVTTARRLSVTGGN